MRNGRIWHNFLKILQAKIFHLYYHGIIIIKFAIDTLSHELINKGKMCAWPGLHDTRLPYNLASIIVKFGKFVSRKNLRIILYLRE